MDSLRVETVTTLAERLGVPRATIVREVVEGRLPYVNVGGHWRFRDKDIDYWQRNQKRTAPLRVVKSANG